MCGNGPAHRHGRLHLPLDKFEPFQFNLPSAHIKRGDDLIIWRGGRVRHIGFVETLLHLALEVLVIDVDHRSLAQGRQRFMR